MSSDPYHFGGTRSVLSWETIVHHPRYKLRGQIRLKDTTLLLGSDLHSNYCLHCRFVSLIFSVSGKIHFSPSFLISFESLIVCSSSADFSQQQVQNFQLT